MWECTGTAVGTSAIYRLFNSCLLLLSFRIVRVRTVGQETCEEGFHRARDFELGELDLEDAAHGLEDHENLVVQQYDELGLKVLDFQAKYLSHIYAHS